VFVEVRMRASNQFGGAEPALPPPSAASCCARRATTSPAQRAPAVPFRRAAPERRGQLVEWLKNAFGSDL